MGSKSTYHFPWPAYPAVRLALLFAAGILLAAFLPYNRVLLLAGFTCCLLLWIFTERLSRRSASMTRSVITSAGYLLLIPMFGLLRVDIQQKSMEKERAVAGYLSLYAWSEFEIEGEIKEVFRTSTDKRAFSMRVSKTILDDRIWSEQYTIRLYVNEGHDKLLGGDPGDEFSAVIRLFDLNDSVNPGDFNYREYLGRDGIYLHGEIIDILEWRSNRSGFSWFALSERVHERIEMLFHEDSVPLAKAVLTGYRQEMNQDEQQSFSRAGLSHIMAVSGMHVGFVLIPFLAITPWLLQWRYGEWTVIILMTVILLLYAGVSGFSPSVSRASLMAWLLAAGKLSRWKRDSLNLMGVSAIFLLIIDPYQLFDIGFQLSYSAVGIILLVLPTIRTMIPASLRFTIRGNLLLILLVSITVQWCLYPIIGWYFGEFSLMGPLANLLVFPVLSAVVPFSLFLILFVDLSPEWIAFINTPALYGFRWMALVASTIGGWSRSWVEVQQLSPLIFILWILIAGLAATMKNPALRGRYAISGILFLIIITGRQVTEKMKPAELTVVVLDVGQGDAIHIETPGKKQILIDSGRWTPSGNSGERVLIPYLDEHGIEELDAVILTHPHADHIGGISALMDHTEIGTIYYSGYPYESELFNRYQKKAAVQSIPLEAVRKGDILNIDPSARFFIVGPDGTIHNRNPNDHSVVMKVVYHQTHFLFTGDAQQHQENRMIYRYGDFLESDFLKVGHHGSRTSSSGAFLSLVQPGKAVVSLSFRNRYRHPHPEAVQRIRRFTDRLYYTSLEGGMIFRSDGQSIRKR